MHYKQFSLVCLDSAQHLCSLGLSGASVSKHLCLSVYSLPATSKVRGDRLAICPPPLEASMQVHWITLTVGGALKHEFKGGGQV